MVPGGDVEPCFLLGLAQRLLVHVWGGGLAAAERSDRSCSAELLTRKKQRQITGSERCVGFSEGLFSRMMDVNPLPNNRAVGSVIGLSVWPL